MLTPGGGENEGVSVDAVEERTHATVLAEGPKWISRNHRPLKTRAEPSVRSRSPSARHAPRPDAPAASSHPQHHPTPIKRRPRHRNHRHHTQRGRMFWLWWKTLSGSYV